MEWNVKSFAELTTHELYAVLRLRVAVFVVEQNCPYHELDDLDAEALHVLFYSKDKKELMAYTRIIAENNKYDDAVAITRVVVHPNYRKQKLGEAIMAYTLEQIDARFGATRVRLSAQLHLQRFYESLGFAICGESYLEDGIPHIEMKKEAMS